MKTVYFVRHGQSEGNIAPVFQGLDSPLSSLGQQQAERIAKRAANLSFDALIASPVRRAQQTAEAISRVTGKPIEYSDLFVERIKPSQVNGRPHTDAQAARLYEEWQKSLYQTGMRVEDGENFDDVMQRAKSALAFLEAYPEERLLVVTHGYFLRALLGRILLDDYLTGPIFHHIQKAAVAENTGISAARYVENKWQFWIYNDHAHLAD